MSKFRMWVCKKIHKHIEWHKAQVIEYEKRLQTHLNSLSVEEMFLFALDTGYCETQDYDTFKRKLKKKRK